MERVVSVVREGGAVVRLPPGFRFHPTDEELVVQYLTRKVLRRPLPASVVRDVELSKFDPWDLPGGDGLTGGSLAKERYLFNFREAKYRNGSRSNRAAGTGYWKATGRDRVVVGSKGDGVIGMKKVLVFHRGKPPHGQRTNWVMHEYRLATAGVAVAPSPGDGHARGLPQGKNSTAYGPTAQQQTGDWVLCRIFQKRWSSPSSTMHDDKETDRFCERDDDGAEAATGEGIRFIDFLRQRDAAAAAAAAAANSSSQASDAAEISCVTDVSGESGCEEEGSSLNCSLNLFTRREL